MDTCKILLQPLVLSCTDYCNSLLLGTAKYRSEKLNTILHMACRVIYDKRKYDHISKDMKQLHWLHVQERNEYRTAVLFYQCVHDEAPEYLSNLIDMEHNCYLRSTVKKQLPVSMSKNSQVCNSSFSITWPRIWNALPFMLKTHKLFNNLNLSLKLTFLVNLISSIILLIF